MAISIFAPAVVAILFLFILFLRRYLYQTRQTVAGIIFFPFFILPSTQKAQGGGGEMCLRKDDYVPFTIWSRQTQKTTLLCSLTLLHVLVRDSC